MIIHVVFDGTLCPDARLSQPRTAPDEQVVAALRRYRRSGDRIVVTSSRAGESWSGGWKTRHAARLICTYLDRHQVPYDEVMVGRPSCDIVIDKRAMNLATEALEPEIEAVSAPRSIAASPGRTPAKVPAGVVPIPDAPRRPPLRDHAPVFIYHLHGGIGYGRAVEPCVETDFLPASHEKLAHIHLVVPVAANGPDWNQAVCNAQELARQVGCDGIVIDPSSCRPGAGGSCTLVLCAIRVAGTLRRSAS